jgi:hypothetical protein
VDGSWRLPLIEEILTATNRVEREFGTTPAVTACRQTFQDSLERLIDLQRGHFSTPYGDIRLIRNLTETVAKELRATSVQDIDLSWWLTPKSQTYWKLQQEAIARGVQITRIFIYHDWNNDLARLCSIQRDAGVNVLRIHRNLIQAKWRTDIIIWDGLCAYETRSNATGEPVLNFFTVSPQDLESAIYQFQMIAASASPCQMGSND